MVDPAPIPDEELQRTYDWMKSWGFLETASCPTDLVNMNVQQHGYERVTERAGCHALVIRPHPEQARKRRLEGWSG